MDACVDVVEGKKRGSTELGGRGGVGGGGFWKEEGNEWEREREMVEGEKEYVVLLML